MFIDSHAHLNHPQFSEDWSEALVRAKSVGISAVINIGYDLASSELAVKQCDEIMGENYPKLFASVAIHPHNAKDWNSKFAEGVRQLARKPSVLAIGEIGLDFHYEFSPRQSQFQAFEEQLELAWELGLPVILHIRNAHLEAIEIVRNFEKPICGVAHCFTGNWDEAKRWLEMGFYIGITGIMTFGRKAENVREVAAKVPIERILIETDSPYLAPEPHRGKRNEPAYLVHVANALAELRGVTVAQIAEVTSQNAIELFRLNAINIAALCK
ncbi:MAG: TatD family hydrolase [Armatimonadetes bacterium]|nr:TatD family hydrolase [Armatimonadota bacterium]MDW8027181.1 TatD family hydrolase [Armatimonadota bacterium]